MGRVAYDAVNYVVAVPPWAEATRFPRSRIIFMKKYLSGLVTLTITIFTASASYASEVKITPLGSHDGEFCARDRALVFEDPNGTRLLYDAGQTVAGGEDERLG